MAAKIRKYSRRHQAKTAARKIYLLSHEMQCLGMSESSNLMRHTVEAICCKFRFPLYAVCADPVRMRINKASPSGKS